MTEYRSFFQQCRATFKRELPKLWSSHQKALASASIADADAALRAATPLILVLLDQLAFRFIDAPEFRKRALAVLLELATPRLERASVEAKDLDRFRRAVAKVMSERAKHLASTNKTAPLERRRVQEQLRLRPTRPKVRFMHTDDAPRVDLKIERFEELSLGGGPSFQMMREREPHLQVEEVDTLLSTEGPSRVLIGTAAEVRARVELASSTASPLAHVTRARVQRGRQIGILIGLHGSAAELVGPSFRSTTVPSAERPSEVTFPIRGLATGKVGVVVQFFQGAAALGELTFVIEVVTRKTRSEEVTKSTRAARSSAAEITQLMITEERMAGGQMRYCYFVSSEKLGLLYAPFFSQPLPGRSQPARYVRDVTQQLVERVLANLDDVKQFSRETLALGRELCSQLFEPALQRELWGGRDDLGTVWLTSTEPHIPWELLTLINPDGKGSAARDTRHLSEYRLVRSLNGKLPPAQLPSDGWQYVRGDDIASWQTDLFDTDLKARGISAQQVIADPGAVLAALEDPSLGVLHLACHGEADSSKIQRARLLLGGKQKRGARELSPSLIESDADLSVRRPLVFLNACESAKQGRRLTDVGGWPKVFIGAGAGAFVGTSWPVRSKPAAAFARTFYHSLLDGLPLNEATGQAREEAKKLGDASWLAYTVYGQPNAKMAALEKV